MRYASTLSLFAVAVLTAFFTTVSPARAETLSGDVVSVDTKLNQIVIKSQGVGTKGTNITVDVPASVVYQNAEGLAKIPKGSNVQIRVKTKKGKNIASVVSVVSYPEKDEEEEEAVPQEKTAPAKKPAAPAVPEKAKGPSAQTATTPAAENSAVPAASTAKTPAAATEVQPTATYGEY